MCFLSTWAPIKHPNSLPLWLFGLTSQWTLPSYGGSILMKVLRLRRFHYHLIVRIRNTVHSMYTEKLSLIFCTVYAISAYARSLVNTTSTVTESFLVNFMCRLNASSDHVLYDVVSFSSPSILFYLSLSLFHAWQTNVSTLRCRLCVWPLLNWAFFFFFSLCFQFLFFMLCFSHLWPLTPNISFHSNSALGAWKVSDNFPLSTNQSHTLMNCFVKTCLGAGMNLRNSQLQAIKYP